MGEAPLIVLQAPLGSSLEWLSFRNPVTTLVGTEIADVLPILEEVDAATRRGLHAAGFLSYEAAPAFDAAMRVRPAAELPLVWFGLFEKPEVVAPPGAARSDGELPISWQPSQTESSYREAIASIHQAIFRGDTYQINYTLRLEAPFTGDAWPLFASLVHGQRSRCCAFVDLGGWALCSASPELFFRLEGDRIVSRPMKGTAPRGRTLEEDERSAAWLRASPKNRAENVMIVDMMRHDLGRIAAVGSVRVTDLWQLEKYPSLFQLTSTVEARTRAALSEIFAALFPCASITGAPKVRAMEIIADLESHPRGIYTGAIGYAAPGRKARFNVAIRTVQVDRLTGVARYGTGGGIVADSEAEEEWREALTKSLVLASPFPTFRLLETIRWDPENGFSLLERHLSRLARSAEYFDFRLEPGQVEARLHEASGGWPGRAQRVRLLVDAAGEVEIEAESLAVDDRAWRLALAAEPIDRSDRFLFHKTTHREVYDRCKRDFPDHDDVVLWNEEGEITETSIANLVLRLGGELVTPALDAGLLPGTLREELLENRTLREAVLKVDDLQRAEEIFLVNSVRGWIPATLDSATLEAHRAVPASPGRGSR